MPESVSVSQVFPVSAEELYKGWLDSITHSEFTGGKADINPSIGGRYTVWDGYISGQTLELRPYHRIVQTWRSTEFSDTDPDSMLEVRFQTVDEGTKLTFNHSRIPDGQSKRYEKGWKENYFEPMMKYFQH